MSRQARELSLLSMLSIKMVTALKAVEVNVSISFSFVKIRIFDADFGRQIHFLTPSRVELIGKDPYYALKPPPIDRARSQLSKTPLVVLIGPLQAKI